MIRRRVRVKFCDPRRNTANRHAVHLARGEQPVEHSIFGQPEHLDRVLDSFRMLLVYLRSQHEGVRTPEDREHAQIDSRVQPHLLAAEVEPTREIGTIEKQEMNWFLYLVNEITGDEDIRNVRLLEFDVRRRIRIELPAS